MLVFFRADINHSLILELCLHTNTSRILFPKRPIEKANWKSTFLLIDAKEPEGGIWTVVWRDLLIHSWPRSRPGWLRLCLRRMSFGSLPPPSWVGSPLEFVCCKAPSWAICFPAVAAGLHNIIIGSVVATSFLLKWPGGKTTQPGHC